MTTGLGPQCFTCRKRQVKCDSATPSCDRCKRDRLLCKGYKRQLKFISYEPTQSHTSGSKTKNADGQKLILLPSRPSRDADYLALIDSFEYYDKVVVPRRFPPHHPFKRQTIDRNVPWHLIPKGVQHLMIFSFCSMQIESSPTDLSSRRDLCYHRGRGLSELQTLLPHAVTDPSGVATMLIILLMGSDIMYPSGNNWLVHYKAASRLLTLRGGCAKCIQDIPAAKNLLTNFAVIDIITSTTCHKRELAENVHHHHEYVSSLSQLRRSLIDTGWICPHQILEAVSRTTLLRASSAADNDGVFEWTRACLESFDPVVWAMSVLEPDGPRPLPIPRADCTSPETVSSMASLARCFQSTAQLYLYLSVYSDCSVDSTLKAIKNRLSSEIGKLLQQASLDLEGPLHTHLWRFLAWPLTVDAYTSIGWSALDTAIEPAPGDLLQRLRDTGVALGSSRLSYAAEFLSAVQMRRSRSTSWDWDDGFPSRVSFAV